MSVLGVWGCVCVCRVQKAKKATEANGTASKDSTGVTDSQAKDTSRVNLSTKHNISKYQGSKCDKHRLASIFRQL